MRKLELYVDSSLKEFNLYKYAEEILRQGSTVVDTDVSMDEVLSLDLFKDFVDLAHILDSYQGWDDEHWSNFLSQMMIAFREKGKPTSINCALAALGIETKETVVREDFNTEEGSAGEPSTKLTVTIDSLDTPNVEEFLNRLEKLIPKLMWTHKLDTSGISVDTVSVNIEITSYYEQTMFDKAARYSVPSSASIYRQTSNWGV